MSLNAPQVSREWRVHLSDLFGGHTTPEEFPPAAPVLCLTASFFSGRQRVRVRGKRGSQREERGGYRDVGTSR